MNELRQLWAGLPAEVAAGTERLAILAAAAANAMGYSEADIVECVKAAVRVESSSLDERLQSLAAACREYAAQVDRSHDEIVSELSARYSPGIIRALSCAQLLQPIHDRELSDR